MAMARAARSCPVTSGRVGSGVITGVGAAINTTTISPGESVVVIGTGGVGLNCIQGAALSGANPLIAVDVNDAKLEAAKAFGATHGVNSTTHDVAAEVRALTERTKPAQQAAVLARKGLPFAFTPSRVLVQRAVAAAHGLLPQASGDARLDLVR